MMGSLRGVRRFVPAVPTAMQVCRKGLVAFAGFLSLAGPAALAHAQALQPGGPVDFGPIAVGSSAQSLTLTFSANVATTIQAVTVTTDGVQGKDFTLNANTCMGTLNPPTSCYITIGFAPTQPGLQKGALSVIDGSGAVVNRLFLHGIGLAPQIVLQPVSVAPLRNVAPLLPSTYQPSAAVVDGGGNLYFNDVANNRILEQASNGTLSQFAMVNTSAQSTMAISGAGTIYITQPLLGVVIAIPLGGAPAALTTPGVTLGTPTGVAVDALGYIYISDAKSNSIVRVAPDGSSAFTFMLTGLATPIANPAGLATDSNFLYVADGGNDRIVQVSLTTSAAAVFPGTFPNAAPTGLAVDPAGDVIASTPQGIFVVSAAGVVTQIAIPANTLLLDPLGIALLSDGQLVVADPLDGLFSLVRSAATINFVTPTKVGVFDATDGYQTLTVQNSGNDILQLNGVDPGLSLIDYALSAAGTCPTATTGSAPAAVQVGIGVTCTYSIGFTPTAGGPAPNGTPRDGTLTISGTSVGVGGTATASVALQGYGVTDVNALSLLLAPSTTGIGEPVSMTVTALANGVVATDFLGTVQFTTSDSKGVFLSGASYTFTAADAGTHTFAAPVGLQFNSLGTFTATVVNGKLTATSNSVLVQSIANILITSSVNPSALNQQTTLTATLSGIAGQTAPTGSVTFLDGTTPLGTVTLANGAASLPVSFATTGAHSITVVYAGDNNYIGSTSTVFTQTVEDFSIAISAGSSSTVTANPGSTATFNFMVTPIGGTTFPNEIDFSVTGLPTAAVAAFTPALLTPGSATTGVTLNITNLTGLAGMSPVKTAALHEMPQGHQFERLAPVALALLVLPVAFTRRRRHIVSRIASLFLCLLACAGLMGLSGCLSATTAGYANGSVTGTNPPPTPKTYNLTVTAVSGQITHTTNVTLTVE